MKKIRTHYDNLQVVETASLEVIKGAYKYLSQRWHPDKNPDQREQAEQITRIINDAYAVLSDPARRKAHDEWIAAQRDGEDASHQAQREAEQRRQAKASKTPTGHGADQGRWTETASSKTPASAADLGLGDALIAFLAIGWLYFIYLIG
jgi:DnaJ-class molecular chaperone